MQSLADERVCATPEVEEHAVQSAAQLDELEPIQTLTHTYTTTSRTHQVTTVSVDDPTILFDEVEPILQIGGSKPTPASSPTAKSAAEPRTSPTCVRTVVEAMGARQLDEEPAVLGRERCRAQNPIVCATMPYMPHNHPSAADLITARDGESSTSSGCCKY